MVAGGGFRRVVMMVVEELGSGAHLGLVGVGEM